MNEKVARQHITLSASKLERLKEAYAKARRAMAEEFEFDGLMFHVGYAAYFLQHFCPKFGVDFNKESF